MGVGTHDREDFRVPDCGFEGGKMVWIVRAGIDHRQPLLRADQICLCAGKGEGRAIGRQHAAHQRFKLLTFACRPGLRGEGHAPHMAGEKRKAND